MTATQRRTEVEQAAPLLIQTRERLDRKFTGEDITSQNLNSKFGPAVREYLQSYRGTFSYLLDMKRRTTLWPNQFAGVLNCMYADLKRAQQKQAMPNATIDLSGKITPVIADGYYTVDGVPELGGGHVTLRIRTIKNSERYEEGTQVAAYLFGPDNTSDYQRFAIVKGSNAYSFKDYRSESHDRQRRALRYLLDHPSLRDELGRRFAQQSGNCYKCNKMLTDPTSIELGIEPICRGA